MKLFSVFPFRIGTASGELLDSDAMGFYKWVAEHITGEEFISIPDAPYSTIPIDNQTMQTRPYYIYEKFWEHVNSLREPVQLLLVEVSNPLSDIVRGSILLHLSHAISTALSGGQELPDGFTGLRFIILLPEIMHPKESSRRYLDPFIKNGKVILIDEKGECVSPKHVNKTFDADEYRMKVVGLRGNPEYSLEKKMIRRLGHFRWRNGGKHSTCSRYFYDGSLCEKEIQYLLINWLNNLHGSEASTILLFHCPMSKWLRNAVLSVGNIRNHTCIDLSAGLIQADFKDINPGQYEPILIFDMVRSGKTFGSIIEDLSPFGWKVEPRIFSIMSSEATDPVKRIREIRVGRKTYNIHYCIQAHPEGFPRDKCEMCLLDIPESSFHEEDYYMLTTYDIWDMVREVGVKQEDNVPGYREPVGAVPKFPEMIQKNGAWLASKVRRLLNDLVPDGFPPDPVVVCPSEEKGSTVFTDHLRLVLGVLVIRIPRSIINKCVSNTLTKTDVEDWRKIDRFSYQQLVSTTVKELIIVDEFCASGNTFKGLRTILGRFGKTVLCYIPLVNFNPSFGVEEEVLTLTLYEWARDVGTSEGTD